MKLRKTVLFPIAAKLITISVAIVLTIMVVSTLIITGIISTDVRITAENNNFALNSHAASEAEIFVSSIITSTQLLVNLISSTANNLTEKTKDMLFDGNTTIAAIVVPGYAELLNDRYLLSLGIAQDEIDDYVKAEQEYFTRAENGETLVLNASPMFGTALLAVLMPVEFKDDTAAVMTLFSAESLADTFSSGTNKAMLANSRGELLVCDESEAVLIGSSITQTEVYALVSSSMSRQQQLVYRDGAGNEFFASFSKLLNGEMLVITQIEGEVVFEALKTALRRNYWLDLCVLFAAILFVWFFSKTISLPVRELGKAVKQIEGGEFNVQLQSLGRDELALLAESIVSMGQGLAERERLKESFGRFTNSEIAEQATKGELKLGGERRQISVFFADLRGFTARSEKMEPEQVVSFLNRYLERMLDCINRAGGTVDKFIGDAIMAVWGAPFAGLSPADNALNAVTAALAMRYALLEFNRQEGAFIGSADVRMGCGISSGEAVAGQIGSSTRMEYTVIGDTVNLASRIESITKPLATDILITEETYKLIADEIIAEEMPEFYVKGKDQAVKLFALVALRNSEGTILQDVEQATTLAEVRKLLGYENPDLSKVDINEEEKKYKPTN